MNCAVTGTALSALENEFFEGRWDVSDRTVFRILCTDAELQAIVRSLAGKLNALYRGLSEGQCVRLLFLMNGACHAGALLSRYLIFPYTEHFVKVTSYTGREQGELRFDASELAPFKDDEHVCVMDELIDSATTMRAVAAALPKATICAVMSKGKASLGETLGYGRIPKNSWLVGFGLDDDGTKRGWVHLFDKRRPDGSFGSGSDEEWRTWREAFVADIRALVAGKA